ncbi:hypothetical protein D3C79_923730 [compost metagenome]
MEQAKSACGVADCSFVFTPESGSAGTRDVVSPDKAAIANEKLLLGLGLTVQDRIGHIEHQIGDQHAPQLGGVLYWQHWPCRDSVPAPLFRPYARPGTCCQWTPDWSTRRR